MPRLIHLNGPPGIGKSTIARRYVADHPEVLNCDIDVLRSLVGGWQDDFAGAGRLIRPAALAMIGAYLGNDRDVVLPQMIVRIEELERFESVALENGGEFVEAMLMDTRDAAVARFHRRGSGQDDPWHEQVRSIVDGEGGDATLRARHDSLVDLLARRPATRIIDSTEGAVDATYLTVLEALGQRRSDGPPRPA